MDIATAPSAGPTAAWEPDAAMLPPVDKQRVFGHSGGRGRRPLAAADHDSLRGSYDQGTPTVKLPMAVPKGVDDLTGDAEAGLPKRKCGWILVVLSATALGRLVRQGVAMASERHAVRRRSFGTR